MHLGWVGKQWFEATDAERIDHLAALRGHFQFHLEQIIQVDGIDSPVLVDEKIFDDVIHNYYGDLRRIEDNGPEFPDDFKQKAFYAFWIRKLKPIQVSQQVLTEHQTSKNWINELVAIKIAITELDIIFGETDISKNLIHDLLFYFRYKSVSPHSLYLILASMYTVNTISIEK